MNSGPSSNRTDHSNRVESLCDQLNYLKGMIHEREMPEVRISHVQPRLQTHQCKPRKQYEAVCCVVLPDMPQRNQCTNRPVRAQHGTRCNHQASGLSTPLVYRSGEIGRYGKTLNSGPRSHTTGCDVFLMRRDWGLMELRSSSHSLSVLVFKQVWPNLAEVLQPWLGYSVCSPLGNSTCCKVA